MKIKALSVALFAVCLILGLPVDGRAAARGGSAYMWYSDGTGTDYYCYGVVKNYNSGAQGTIRDHLQTMYTYGQRRLMVMVFFARGDADPASGCSSGDARGDSFNSASASSTADWIGNLADYLTYAATHDFGGGGHFEEFLILMSPQGSNFAGNWSSYSSFTSYPSYYDENWNVITQLRSALNGLFYRLVLQDEPFWHPNYMTTSVSYITDLWRDYESAYGSDVKYSGITIAADRTNGATQVQLAYFVDIADHSVQGRPYLYFLNIWNQADLNYTDFDNQMEYWHGDYTSGVIISAAYYNDNTEAAQLESAASSTSRPIHWLSQFPVNRSDVWVRDVTYFYNYVAHGF